MLNRRHKAALFIALIVTGCSLLAGATLAEGLGVLILGLTFAWVLGSAATTRLLQSAKKVPSRSWPMLRMLIWTGLAGCLLIAIGVVSNFNTFLVVSSMALFGMLTSSFVRFRTESKWLGFLAAILGPAAFIGTAVGLGDALLSSGSSDDANLFAQSMAYGAIAFLLGIFWLIKGWRLVLLGITAYPVDANAQLEDTSKQKGTVWLHILLFVGVALLTFCLGTLAFSAFSSSVLAFETKTSDTAQNPLSPVLGLMLFAWWPYACWQSILEREPNTTTKYASRHKLITAILGAFLTIVLSIAITFGIQNGNDRMSVATVENATKGFLDVANKIGSIKKRELKTTQDYIDSYEETEPLITAFDSKVQQLTQVVEEADKRDKSRGPLNIQHLYRKHDDWMSWDKTAFDLAKKDSDITKKQIQVVRSMAALPERDQVEYWKLNFQPLQQEEESLRQQIADNQQRMPK